MDNILRPKLVGQDTKMHELPIFFSTLGGLLLFGATGFIVGPILAALFVTAWEMFGTTFRKALDEPSEDESGLPTEPAPAASAPRTSSAPPS